MRTINTQRTEYYNVTLNTNGSVNTKQSELTYSTIYARMQNPSFSDYLLITWGDSLFLAKAIEKNISQNGDIKFIADCEHNDIQYHMVFTLNSVNQLTTTKIETYQSQSSEIPLEYKEIDFIESDGGSYIDTGILPSADLKIVAKFQHAATYTIDTAERQYIFGTYSRDTNNEVDSRYQFYYGGAYTSGTETIQSPPFCGWGKGSENIGYKKLSLTPDIQEHTLIIENGTFTFDGEVQATFSNNIFTGQNPIYLFASNENGTVNYFSKNVRGIQFEFYRNNELIANFVPRLHVSNNTFGMLETVSNTFHASEGQGHFRNDSAIIEPPYGVVVTPEQFGAKGDGEADDTLAIQAAFDAAKNNGTVIFGKKKTYLVSRRDDDFVYTYSSYGPQLTKYMLRIRGSMTILGQGSTIAYKYPITKEQYDEEYTILFGQKAKPNADPPVPAIPSRKQDAKSAPMLFLDSSDIVRQTGLRDFNERQYVVIRSLVLDGGMADNGVDRESAAFNGGMSLGNWKAIWGHGAIGCYLELDGVTVKEFACEGVFGLWESGARVKAYGCTFQNCMPTTFNIHGSVAECVGCTFIQNEKYTWSSEYNARTNIFDSCYFIIDNGYPAIANGNDFDDVRDLIIRNCIFNRSDNQPYYPPSQRFPNGVENHRSIILSITSTNFIVDSCIFNDAKTQNSRQPLVTTKTLKKGQVSNCVFNRPEINSNNNTTFYPIYVKDSTSNIVHIDSFESGGSIKGRGLVIKTEGLTEYRFGSITPPKTITIIPIVDCNFKGYGFVSPQTIENSEEVQWVEGNNFITINKKVTAHIPIKINVDYLNIGEIVYNSDDFVSNFCVKCDDNITGNYDVWSNDTTYSVGTKIRYPDASGSLYERRKTYSETEAAAAEKTPPTEDSGWTQVGAFNIIIET